VQDTGPGTDENNAAPLAQEFRPATRQRPAPLASDAAASNSGEGVGLMIVKRLCELLDARLELGTEAGRDATFRVILPRRYLRQQATAIQGEQ